MATKLPKLPTGHVPSLGAALPFIGGPRLLTSVQRAELRSKLADVEAKLRQMTAAERNRRR